MADAGHGERGCAPDPCAASASIEDVLDRDGVYVCTTVGTSMWPMLRNRRDTVVVEPLRGELRRYDVPLYRSGGRYVLHRVVGIEPGGYAIRGDNCVALEHVGRDQVVGVLAGFYRADREVDMGGAAYRAYSRLWVAAHPLYRACKGAKSAAGRLARRLVGPKGAR